MSYFFGPFQLDGELMQLRRAGSVVLVAPQVLELLVYLIERRDRPVSRSELKGCLWPGEAVSEAALCHLVTETRRVLGDRVTRPRYISTVEGLGYRFVAAVEGARPHLGPVKGFEQSPAFARAERGLHSPPCDFGTHRFAVEARPARRRASRDIERARKKTPRVAPGRVRRRPGMLRSALIFTLLGLTVGVFFGEARPVRRPGTFPWSGSTAVLRSVVSAFKGGRVWLERSESAVTGSTRPLPSVRRVRWKNPVAGEARRERSRGEVLVPAGGLATRPDPVR